MVRFDSRVLCNRESRTPPGPEGSNGSEPLCVLQGSPAIIFSCRRPRLSCTFRFTPANDFQTVSLKVITAWA